MLVTGAIQLAWEKPSAGGWAWWSATARDLERMQTAAMETARTRSRVAFIFSGILMVRDKRTIGKSKVGWLVRGFCLAKDLMGMVLFFLPAIQGKLPTVLRSTPYFVSWLRCNAYELAY